MLWCVCATAPFAANLNTQVTHTRNLEAHYGTVQIVDAHGAPLESASFLELTDHVTATLAGSIATEPGRDARVTSTITAWVDGAVTDVEWIFGAPEGLDAAASLLDDLGSYGGPAPTLTSDTGALDRGIQSYEIASWTTFDEAGLTDHTAIADVHYYERNIVKTAPAPPEGPSLRRRLPAAALQLPFRSPGQASALYAFGLDPWSASGEVHAGIDVVAAHTGSQPALLKVPVVAPASGRVEWVRDATSGAGLSSVLVLIRINDSWFTAVTLEPQSAAPETALEQAASIHVVPGQAVRGGQTIAELVVWNVAAGSYPHVHLDLFYKSPAQTLEDLAEHFADIAISDGTALPPRAGPGSPWDPRDLGIPSTAFCPYEYSSARAKAAYDLLPTFAANGDPCACPCAYGSAAGDCGHCR